MTIGIIVAMKAELEHLLPTLDTPRSCIIDGVEFHSGRIGTNNIVVMQCGIGKVNAAIGTLLLIREFKPDLIINTGIAGGTGRGAGILDVVVAEEVAYHDVWCGPGNVRGQVQGHPARYSCAEGNALLPALSGIASLKHGLVASGDQFVDTPEDLARILSLHPDAIAIDMESGAIAQVCHMHSVPFAMIRVVSDYPGADDHLDQYQNFWSQAPEATFNILKTCLA